MIRRPPRSTPLYSSAASDVYKRQVSALAHVQLAAPPFLSLAWRSLHEPLRCLSLIHISEPTRHLRISYAVFCLKKKTKISANDISSEANPNQHRNAICIN